MQSILDILPNEILLEIARHTDYAAYQNFRSTCKTLNNLRPFKVCGFEEYCLLLQSRGLEVLKLGEIVDADMDEDEDAENYWIEALFTVKTPKALDFQKKVRLDLYSLTHDQYYYVCSNFLAEEALRIVDLALKNPEAFKHIYFTAGTDHSYFGYGFPFVLGFSIVFDDMVLLKTLLQFLPTSGTTLTDMFLYSCRYDSRDVAQMLLLDFDIDPSAEHQAALPSAADNGNLEMVQILMANPRIDPSTNGNEALISAARNGHFEVVQYLLADPRVDPTSRHNQALKSASEHEHEDVVRLLLTDPRVVQLQSIEAKVSK